MHREGSDLPAQKPEPFALVSETEFSRMNPADRAKYIEALITYVKRIRQDPPDEPFSLREQTPTLGEKDA